jgi:hypothetical protein
MIRTILGYAVLAIVALILLKVAFTLFGLVLGLAITVLVLAALGYGMYLVLFFISPGTAARVKAFVIGQGNRPSGARLGHGCRRNGGY